MKALGEVKWGEFVLSKIFEIYATRSGIDKNKLDLTEGDYPYITRTDRNNGWERFIKKQNAKWSADRPNVISIGLDTQTVFYQPIQFYTGQNIQVLSNEKLNQHIALFLLPLLKIQIAKYSWGSNGATLSRLKKQKILLPIKNNQPDWCYMEEYMKEKESLILERYKRYLSQIIDNQCDKWRGVNFLNKVSRKSFMLGELFDFEKGNQNNMSSLSYGAIPLVSAKKDNNGYKAFVGNNGKKCFGGCRLTLNNDGDGGAGIAYYQPKDFMLDSHVTALNHKQAIDKYALLYISYCITKQRSKFGHGYSITGNRLHTFRIILPVDTKGNPDYDYMGAYMRNEETKCLKRYLDYLEKKMN